MTISTTTNSVQYTGNGVTTVFSVPFVFYDASDLIVTYTVIATGVDTVKTITTDYTVSGGNGSTGSVTALAAPASTIRITIERSIPYTQETDFLEGAAVLAETVEESFDRGVVLSQQLLDGFARSLKFPATLASSYTGLLPAPEDGKFLTWDGATGQIANADIADLSTAIDTVFAGLASGDVLEYNGTNWINGTGYVKGSSNNTLSGVNTFTGKVLYPDDGELTIDTGAITVTGVFHTVDTESDAASDDLDTINGGADGQLLVVRTEDNARDVVLTQSGNIVTPFGVSVTLGTTSQTASLVYDGTLSKWVVIAISSGYATAAQGALADTALQPEDKITLGTMVASTSGTSIDFTSIPAGVKRITVNFSGVSTNGTDAILVQIGDSGGVENTGYLGASTTATTAVATINYTAGIGIAIIAATNVIHGSIVLTLMDASTNRWAAFGVLSSSDSARSYYTSSSKALSDTLDRLRITTSGGSNTFDAGNINIAYE